jgi:hypothetical protein
LNESLIIISDDVFWVEVALDLNELEALTTQRRDTRDMLEKSIALWKATGETLFVVNIIIIYYFPCRIYLGSSIQYYLPL